MKRFWGHVLAGLAVSACAGLVASACVHDDSSIFIRDALAPPTSTTGGVCTYTSDPTQPSLSQGTLDVGVANSYVAELLIGNQLNPVGDPTQARTETSRVQIQGATVKITDSTGNQLAFYTTLTSTTIDPAQGSTPSYSPASIIAVDPMTAQSVTVAPGSFAQVVSYIQVFGQTLGGKHVESNTFQFPVTLCNGCLVQFSSATTDPFFAQPNCLLVSSMTSATPPCVEGQDQLFDCSLCVSQFPCVCGGNEPNCPKAAVAGDAGLIVVPDAATPDTGAD